MGQANENRSSRIDEATMPHEKQTKKPYGDKPPTFVSLPARPSKPSCDLALKGLQRLIKTPATTQTVSFQAVLCPRASCEEPEPEEDAEDAGASFPEPLVSSWLSSATAARSATVPSSLAWPPLASLILWMRDMVQTAKKATSTPAKSNMALPPAAASMKCVSNVPNTKAVPMPSGKATASPHMSMPLTSRRLARLKIAPAPMAIRDFCLKVSSQSQGNHRRSADVPTGAIPEVSAKSRDVNNTPAAKST
mmetsp:Transcript_44910/g.100986  ORF Transcript_44910/g.100986 Transcript_44910/m.100986 type:complete len:250 (+) Transcript_44910:423-1172(+)